MNEKLNELLQTMFKEATVSTDQMIYGYRITAKGKVLSSRKTQKKEFVTLDHNKKKQYLLPEGTVVLPLVDLNVMKEDGSIVKSHYDKYRQINRFLEMIDDVIGEEQSLKIIDFGCGKSYLTFILYYYLVYVKQIQCEITGLDLKEEVIDACNAIALKYGYEHLKFFKGDISQFKEQDSVDMIVTLHACDTATDYALYHAVKMNCKYIFSVPCCQHEVNNQLKKDYLPIMDQFGILKERFSALATDAIRAQILRYYGYKTQILEFVDFENSPKNLLIRAVLQKQKSKDERIRLELEEWLKEMNIRQTLYDLLMKEK